MRKIFRYQKIVEKLRNQHLFQLYFLNETSQLNHYFGNEFQDKMQLRLKYQNLILILESIQKRI